DGFIADQGLELHESIVRICAITKALYRRDHVPHLSGYNVLGLPCCNFPAAPIQPQELVLDVLQEFKRLIVDTIGKKFDDLLRIVEDHCDEIVVSTVHRETRGGSERLLHLHFLGQRSRCSIETKKQDQNTTSKLIICSRRGYHCTLQADGIEVPCRT